ncbi:MAG: hypothetical protein KAJ46_07395 [Sedimentisphaerales bacterium]|nr:hypothetical protein [Sedimentisphaerales bacterium]
METFIILVSLAAAAAGSLILLTCMAGKRSQLVKAFNIQQEKLERESRLQQNRNVSHAEESVSAPAVS